MSLNESSPSMVLDLKRSSPVLGRSRGLQRSRKQQALLC